MNKKNIIPFVFAIVIPLVFVVGIGFEVIRQEELVKPTHNFIYATGDDYYNFEVINGKIQFSPYGIEVDSPTAPSVLEMQSKRLYLYDVKTHTSQSISLAQAQNYTLQEDTSPDGYIVTDKNDSGLGIIPSLFFNESDGEQIVIEHELSGRQKTIKLAGNVDYYYDFRFIGWIIR